MRVLLLAVLLMLPVSARAITDTIFIKPGTTDADTVATLTDAIHKDSSISDGDTLFFYML